MTRERDIEAWIRRRIEKMGGEFWKFTSPGQDGVPDRIALFPDGRLVFVELKTATGRLSMVQKYQIKRLRELDQQVAVVYGEDGAKEFIQDMNDHVVSSIVYDGMGGYEI